MSVRVPLHVGNPERDLHGFELVADPNHMGFKVLAKVRRKVASECEGAAAHLRINLKSSPYHDDLIHKLLI